MNVGWLRAQGLGAIPIPVGLQARGGTIGGIVSEFSHSEATCAPRPQRQEASRMSELSGEATTVATDLFVLDRAAARRGDVPTPRCCYRFRARRDVVVRAGRGVCPS